MSIDSAYRCQRRKLFTYMWLFMGLVSLALNLFNWMNFQWQFGKWWDLAFWGFTFLMAFYFLYKFWYEMITDIALIFPTHIDLFIRLRRTALRITYEDIQQLELRKNRTAVILIKDRKRPVKLSLAFFEYPEDFWIALNEEVERDHQRRNPGSASGSTQD